MEEIIILILFTYPGAIADYFHKLMIRGKQYDNEMEEHFRIARDFFLSAIITLMTMILFCRIRNVQFTLQAVADALQKGKNLWIYAPMSLFVSLAVSWVWMQLNKAVLRKVNKCKITRGIPTQDETKSV